MQSWSPNAVADTESAKLAKRAWSSYKKTGKYFLIKIRINLELFDIFIFIFIWKRDAETFHPRTHSLNARRNQDQAKLNTGDSAE